MRHNDEFMRKVNEIRESRKSRDRRRMELGYDGWQKREDGSFFKHTPKGIQNWYDTRTLFNLVTERMDRNEKISGRRVCHINGKWQLQIRGKHLRRLLKAMPNVKQIGRMLVEEKK